MSIELYEKIRALEARVAELETILRPLEGAIRQAHDNVAMQSSSLIRKRPGPPKGYKRQPKVISG